ncbi:hypothetical protein AK830_g946 [Neonectria ditissima]|uniref:Xylanolytic transcriptional activator regulatory domain-containing protein n=1 Tax=Neonectria ditissima TaxID=78410 RepID=A0A0P7BXL1_9HYPO|nr:hypothetical protein AK830_g946 [Neonectria ditissima]
MTQDPLCEQHNLKAHLSTCEQTLNLSIETYDILAVPSFENVLALTLVVIKAQNESKPMLCCTLVAAAASHCQMLGYHRETTYSNGRLENAENKRRIFWSLYLFDKNMSLILGHASKMQDFEIDAQYPCLSADPARIAWDKWFTMAIKLARVQGQIFDRLYSASALKAPVAVREERISELDTVLRQWRVDFEQIDGSRVNHPQVFALSSGHWDIMYYSTRTALLRASSTSGTGSEITSECFHAARLSLESHLRCFSGLKKSAIVSDKKFANWVLHSSSLCPFIVIFLHAIAATNLEDVHLLDEVVLTLQHVQEASTSSKRLYQICATFAQLAGRMVEERSSFLRSYDQHTDSLQLFDAMTEVPFSWPETGQEFFETEMATDGLPDWDVPDMTAILNSWVEGQTSVFSMCGTTP